jgi:hypothetical protein
MSVKTEKLQLKSEVERKGPRWGELRSMVEDLQHERHAVESADGETESACGRRITRFCGHSDCAAFLEVFDAISARLKGDSRSQA